MFTSLCEHASEIQNISDQQLYSWLSTVDEDCNKVHVFCHNMLKSPGSSKILREMFKPLTTMARKLENCGELMKLKNSVNIVAKLNFEIIEINKTLFQNLWSSLYAWEGELSLIKSGGVIDFSSKNHLAILETGYALISHYQQMLASYGMQKHYEIELMEILKIVAKIQKEIVKQINPYFEKYLQCAKKELENGDLEDFQESLAVFQYFNNGLHEAIYLMTTMTQAIIKLENETNKLPFNKEMKIIVETLNKNIEELCKILEKNASNLNKSSASTNIDVASSWDSLKIRRLFYLENPQMIDDNHIIEALRNFRQKHFQLIPLDNIIKPPPSTIKLNNIKNIIMTVLYCFGKLKKKR